jgi:hypothetical protein
MAKTSPIASGVDGTAVCFSRYYLYAFFYPDSIWQDWIVTSAML